jgi:hypothetical protein
MDMETEKDTNKDTDTDTDTGTRMEMDMDEMSRSLKLIDNDSNSMNCKTGSSKNDRNPSLKRNEDILCYMKTPYFKQTGTSSFSHGKFSHSVPFHTHHGEGLLTINVPLILKVREIFFLGQNIHIMGYFKGIF